METRLNKTKAARSDSHPDADERAARFESIAVLRPEEFAMLQHFRRCSTRILDAVDTEIALWLDGLTPAMMREIDQLHCLPDSPI